MNLADITPLVLTYNEEPNIGRTLERLTWASEVVVVDSFSTDATPRIAAFFPNVRLVQRSFDTHARQWAFGLEQVRTSWVLALDADHQVSPDVVVELESLSPGPDVAGYRAPFVYAVEGVNLRGSLYPPRLVLGAVRATRFIQDGHTQRMVVDGGIASIRAPLTHDDRKSFREFVARQKRYMRLEAAKLHVSSWAALPLSGRIRKLVVVAPFAVALHVLFVRGVILDGFAGLRYATERFLAEVLLSRELLRQIRSAPPD